ncbi:MAG: NTP/NDP exchange transporter [Alphaproteobacteria bacterium]|nr:NTP/NDP exchange transporter [Alphaproteobacteria bacterium]
MFLWPVFPEEKKITIFLSAIFFLIWAINTLIYPLHYSLLINAPNSGIEVIGHVKAFGSIPIGILFIFCYGILQTKYTKIQVVTAVYSFFIVFYLVYAFFIIPNNKSLVIDPATISQYMADYPDIKWLFPIYGNWPTCIFYMITDAWISVSISQFFWQTANHYIHTNQAPRLYPIFIIFGGLGSIFFSPILDSLIAFVKEIDFTSKRERIIYLLQLVIIIEVCLTICVVFLFVKVYTIFSPLKQTVKRKVKQPSSKSGFSGFVYLFHSSYLFYIFITLFCSGTIYQVLNYLWRSELVAYSSTPSAYNEILTHYAFWEGLGMVLFALLAKSFIQKRGWTLAAYITPVLSIFTAVPFMVLLIYCYFKNEFDYIININPHYMLAMLGSFQTITMAASLSCLYYPTKEMTYIPLNKNLKSQGKTATDVLGKSCSNAGSGIIQGGFLSSTGGIDIGYIPHILLLITALFITWLYATKGLAKKYLSLISSR